MGKTRGKGEGGLYRRANGRWVGTIEIDAPGGRHRRSVSGTDKATVLRKLKRLRDEVESGVVGIDITMAEWCERWMTICRDERGLKPSTLYGYQSYLDTWVLPHIGKTKLRRLTVDHIRRVYTAMRDADRSPASIRQCHAILRRCLKVAEREQRIARNVADLIDVPVPPKRPHGQLTSIQAKRVLRAAQTPRELARLACALILGLRQGEALGLRWSDIDLKAGTLEVSAALHVVRGQGVALGTPKSASSLRIIPMPAGVVTIMTAWRQEAGRGAEWVFPGADGQAERDFRADWQRWSDALTRAGVPHVPLHGARGTAASLLGELGVPDRIIADILGHADVRVTQGHYLQSRRSQLLDALTEAAGELLP